MFEITKQFHFSASHRLTAVPEGHPCGRLHGHNYIVELVMMQADEAVFDHRNQWVRDFGDLSAVKRWIDRWWDHRDLNEYFDGWDGSLVETTAEMLAHHLFKRFKGKLPELVAVRISETPKTWAEYRP